MADQPNILVIWGDDVGMWNVGAYSHGMKQRLIMCAALLHDPEVLVVDEPMVGLDPRSARILKARIDPVVLDAAAMAVAETPQQVVDILAYATGRQ